MGALCAGADEQQLDKLGEFGLMCPISVTDTSTLLVERYASEEIKNKYLPGMTSQDMSKILKSAQFMTEKTGGSDVSNLELEARHENGAWRLYGEKWFCSCADGDVALLLARPEGAVDGNNGLALFALPRRLEDGHFLFEWGTQGGLANFGHRISEPPTVPPQTLWVEWQYRSNIPIPATDFGCDGSFSVDYRDIQSDGAYMFQDAVVAYGGVDSVLGLDPDIFHSYRFESLDEALGAAVAHEDVGVAAIRQPDDLLPIHLFHLAGAAPAAHAPPVAVPEPSTPAGSVSR